MLHIEADCGTQDDTGFKEADASFFLNLISKHTIISKLMFYLIPYQIIF